MNHKMNVKLKTHFKRIRHNYKVKMLDIAEKIGINESFFRKMCCHGYKIPTRIIVGIARFLKNETKVTENEILLLLLDIFKHNGYIPLSLIPKEKIEENIKISLIHSCMFDKIKKIVL